MYGRQADSNQGQQMLKRHGNLTPYARLLRWSVCWAESLNVASSLSPFIYPGCLHSHQGNQPWSSVIKRIHYTLRKSSCWTIYNYTHQYAAVTCICTIMCEPRCCQCESSRIRLIEFLFENRYYTMKINEICLPRKSAKIICGGKSTTHILL